MYTEEFDVPGRAGSATGAANKTPTIFFFNKLAAQILAQFQKLSTS
jgi:hypothetical protein